MLALGALAAALLSTSFGEEPAYVLQTTPVKRIEAEYVYERTFPHHVASEWVVFLAQPPELPGQTRVAASAKPASAKCGT